MFSRLEIMSHSAPASDKSNPSLAVAHLGRIISQTYIDTMTPICPRDEVGILKLR